MVTQDLNGLLPEKSPVSATQTTRRRTPPREARLARASGPVVAEVLERRRLLTISVQLVGSVLVVQGDSAANTLTVYQENIAGTYRIGVIHTNPDPDVRYENANWHLWDGETGVQSIDIDGNGGDDILTIERDASPTRVGDTGVDVPADMYGGGNHDELYGGDFADTIGGGDTLYGYGGNDTLRGYENGDDMNGGPGDDLMYGGDGNDVMNGDTGHDTMYGEAGDDTFFAQDNTGDYVDGGTGSDSAQRDISTDTLVSIESFF